MWYVNKNSLTYCCITHNNDWSMCFAPTLIFQENYRFSLAHTKIIGLGVTGHKGVVYDAEVCMWMCASSPEVGVLTRIQKSRAWALSSLEYSESLGHSHRWPCLRAMPFVYWTIRCPQSSAQCPGSRTDLAQWRRSGDGELDVHPVLQEGGHRPALSQANREQFARHEAPDWRRETQDKGWPRAFVRQIWPAIECQGDGMSFSHCGEWPVVIIDWNNTEMWHFSNQWINQSHLLCYTWYFFKRRLMAAKERENSNKWNF